MFDDDFNSNNTFESLFRKPSSVVSSYDGNQNPILKKNDGEPPSFFLNIPSSPLFDEHELSLNQILSQNQIVDHQQYQVCAGCNQIEHIATDSTKKELIMKKSSSTTKAGSKLNNGKVVEAVKRRRNLAAIPRKRSGKKDRHSKICTAQGVRDRRMRLSLQVARKFFDLQDLLGYDKASKTIEWLFNKSKKAIKDLTKDHPLSSKEAIHTSRTEETKSSKEVILSRTEEEAKKDSDVSGDVKGQLMMDLKDKRISRKRVSRVNTRESREKARARARCRTKEKMMIKIMENMSHLCESSNSDPDKLGSLEGHQDSSGCHNQKVLDLGGIEKLLCSANSSSSPSSSSLQISDYHSSGVLTGCVDPNSNLRGFAENWDLMNSYDILNKSTTHFADVTNNEVAFAGNNTISSSIYSASSPNYGSLFHQ